MSGRCCSLFAFFWAWLSVCVWALLKVGGTYWCHRVQQADPERGPLLAARVSLSPSAKLLPGHERGMAPFKPASCPLNWHICKPAIVRKPILISWVGPRGKSGLYQRQRTWRTWRRLEEKVGRSFPDCGAWILLVVPKRRIRDNWIYKTLPRTFCSPLYLILFSLQLNVL